MRRVKADDTAWARMPWEVRTDIGDGLPSCILEGYTLDMEIVDTSSPYVVHARGAGNQKDSEKYCEDFGAAVVTYLRRLSKGEKRFSEVRIHRADRHREYGELIAPAQFALELDRDHKRLLILIGSQFIEPDAIVNGAAYFKPSLRGQQEAEEARDNFLVRKIEQGDRFAKAFARG